MKSTVCLIIACSCILSVWGAENKSVSEKDVAEKKPVVTKDLTAEEARRQTSYKPPLRNLPTPGSEHGLVDEYPPGPGPAHASSGYTPSGPSNAYDSPHSSGGYDSSYPSSGYGSSHPSSGYGSSHPSTSHTSSGSYSSSNPSSGYGSSHPSSGGGYGSSHPSSGGGYGSSHPSSGGYSSSHPSSGGGSGYSSGPSSSGAHGSPNAYGSQPHSPSGYGPSSHSSGEYSAPYSGSGYGPSRPSKSQGPSYPSSGHGAFSSGGYSQPYSQNAHGPLKQSYDAPPPSSAHRPVQSAYAEYGPESIRDHNPVNTYGSHPHSTGSYLNIGSGAQGGHYPNSYESGDYAKPLTGGYDRYSRPAAAYGNEQKYTSTDGAYRKPYKNVESDGYRGPAAPRNRKRSNRHGGYAKAPLSSSDPSSPYSGYDNKPLNDYSGHGKRQSYGGYDNSPRGYGSYDKPASGYRNDYNKPSIGHSKTSGNHELYDSYSQAQKPKSYSKLAYDNYDKRDGRYGKRVQSDAYKPASGYNDDAKKDDEYAQPLVPSDYAHPDFNYKVPASRYAGYSKPAGSGGASQYDGGYGGYATGPPARGYGDYSKVPPTNLGANLDFTRNIPSLSGQRGLGLSPNMGFNKAYGQISQTGYSKAYDTYNTGSPNLNGYGLNGNTFSNRGLMGNHGLYGAASYGRNYGGDRYGGLNKGYTADQSIYGGYSQLY